MQIYKEEHQDPFRKDCTSKFDLNTCAGLLQLQKQQKPKLLNVGLTTRIEYREGKGFFLKQGSGKGKSGFLKLLTSNLIFIPAIEANTEAPGLLPWLRQRLLEEGTESSLLSLEIP